MGWLRDRPRKKAEINEGAKSRLAWIPWYVDERRIHPPDGLKDFQQTWFWNLLFASLSAEWQGYLPMSSNLWMLAGALTRERWDANSSAVLAAFEIQKMEDGKLLLFFPSLVETINSQFEKIRDKKKRIPEISETSTGFHRGVGSLSFSFSDLSKHNQQTKPSAIRARARAPAREVCPLGQCNGTGLRKSHYAPGKVVQCDCRAGVKNGTG